MMDNDKNRRLRFTFEDDVVFLREVLSHNPIANPEQWDCVRDNLGRLSGKVFQVKTLKQHLQLLLQLWLKKDNITKIRSGEEEPYTEKDVLLQEISSICNEVGSSKQRKRVAASKELQISNLGREMRERSALFHMEYATPEEVLEEAVMEEVIADNEELPIPEHTYSKLDMDEISTQSVAKRQRTQTETTSTSSGQNTILRPVRRRINKSRTLRSDALSYLSEKNDRELKLREKELALEERKIVIEEKRVRIEEAKLALLETKEKYDLEERKQKLEWEKMQMDNNHTEKRMLHSLLESQQKIIDMLTTKLHN